jgi:CheY-like chemotaxis protein
VSGDGGLGPLDGVIVLIVEDDAASAKLLSKVLRNEGCVVHHATEAGAVSQLLHGGLRPAVILLDLDLPWLNGLDLARIFRQTPATAAVPIIAVSASGEMFSREAALAAGCDEYVRKPIDVTTFAALVARLLRERGG